MYMLVQHSGAFFMLQANFVNISLMHVGSVLLLDVLKVTGIVFFLTKAQDVSI